MPHKKSFFKTLKGFGKYTKVISLGKQIERSPIKAFVYLNASEKSEIKIGFATNKAIRKSVERNKLKRWMKEALRANEEMFLNRNTTLKSLEVVFMFTGKAVEKAEKKLFYKIKHSFTEICTAICKIEEK